MASPVDKSRRTKRGGLHARLYCDYLTDPKVLGLLDERRGLEAWGVHTLVITMSRLHLTDGRVSKAMLRACHGTPAHAQALVDAGLWSQDGAEWTITGYGKDNDTRTDVEVRSFRGRIDACRKYMLGKGGKECACGHHDEEGRLVGDPVGDLQRYLEGHPVGHPRVRDKVTHG